MSPPLLRQPLPEPVALPATPADARKLAEGLMEVMSALLGVIERETELVRAMLQVNLTVLATAHAVSEGIVRGVNTEMQRRNVPNTYTATGQRAAPGPRNISPLAVSRSL